MTIIADDRVAELDRANAELRAQLAACRAELAEVREQQTATAEVLEVINSSPDDLTPVFEAIVEKAHTLCSAACGSLQLWDGEKFRAVALRGFSEAMAETLRRGYVPGTNHPCRPLLEGERVAHCADLAEIDDPVTRAGGVALGGVRTILFVALRKDNALLGQIVAARQEVRPFTEKEIALVENFAAQAVIAMENARLLTETREALEQQQAVAEILQVINRSPGELQPVFDMLLEKAMQLCGAAFGLLAVLEGEQTHTVAAQGLPPALAEWRRNHPVISPQNTLLAHVLAGEPYVHTLDLKDDDLYRRGEPLRRANVDLGGARTSLYVPLIRDRDVLGTIHIYRQEVRPFSDKHIALLQNFAAQAVIAMENARLLTETREALEQQTATAEVLQVINSSPGDLAPVFDAMLEKAIRLCGGIQGALWTLDGAGAKAVASHGNTPEFVAMLRERELAGLDPPEAVRLTMRERLFHVPDLVEHELYRTEEAITKGAVELSGVRSLVGVALLKDDAPIGAFMIGRREVRPFSETQIALLQNFAAQAVIAMENARLITETREALEQQTATAEVLQVINSSPGDLTPVFDAMLQNALRLCEADFGVLQVREGDRFRTAALRGVPAALAEFLSGTPREPGKHTAVGRMLDGEDFVHFEDMTAERAYQSGDRRQRAFVELGGTRSYVAVALRKDGRLLGSLAAYRREVRPFTDKQIALLQNFAAQAVIAMENARLLTETREALEQQTATAEVLQVINSSPGDLSPVFDAMLEKAMRLCEAAFGQLAIHDGERFRTAATRGVPSDFAEYRKNNPPIYGPGTTPARLLTGERVICSDDLKAEPAYLSGEPNRRALVDLGGARSAAIVALTKEERVLGFIQIYRQEVRPFSDKQTALLENFAAQAVIAMENARLLTETREALEQQTATAEVLQVINSSPGDLAPVFDAMLDKAHRLCGVEYGTLQLYDSKKFCVVSTRGYPEPVRELLRQPYALEPNNPIQSLIDGRPLLAFSDLAEHHAQPPNPRTQAAVAIGIRSMLFLPLRKDNVLLGMISAGRKEVRPFSEKEIALLQNFSAQAVIAIENARLISETREALEQQTATAEVLQVINSSPGDLAPVFDAILEKTLALCAASFGDLSTYAGEQFLAVATRGFPPALIDFYRNPFTPGPKSYFGQLLNGEDVLHIADMAAELSSAPANALSRAGVERGRALVELGNARTGLFLALRKDDALLGAMRIFRQEVEPFTEKQIALVQNFAAQAVIAMENARLITETREALEQQTATAEVLGVINSSPGNLAPVFAAMLEKAVGLCDAAYGVLRTFDGEFFHIAAMRGEPDAVEGLKQLGPIDLASVRADDMLGAIVRGEAVVHITGVRETDTYRDNPVARERAETANQRTWLAIALRKDGALLGVIMIYRTVVRSFTSKQIALLQNFAAQAVIAMENARLITETSEALEQQTATAEVLQVINSSPGDLKPVFDAMLEKATRLCEAPFGILRTWDGESFHFGAVHGDPRFCDWVRQRAPVRPDRDDSLLGRIEKGERVVRFADARDEVYRTSSGFREMVEASGIRSAVTVALHKDDALLGIITVYRQEVRPFSDKQIALLQNFAAQAVIAMENARLITETREALEQQTATAEVLQVINSSPGDLLPVFDAILEKAHKLCGVSHGALVLCEGETFRAVAIHSYSGPFAEQQRQGYRGADNPITRSLIDGERFVHIADLAQIRHPMIQASVENAGVRTGLYMPLRKDDVLLGMISSCRREIRPFSDKEIAVLENFAAQAVIAMENARLLTETREALEQQTATAEVLQVINSSPGDLAPVFDAMLEKAMNLCEAAFGGLWTFEQDRYVAVALRNVPAAYSEFLADTTVVPGPGTAPYRFLKGEQIVHNLDLKSEEAYAAGDRQRRALVDLGGARTALQVPLRKDDRVLGVITIYRQEVRAFSDKQVALLQNFAAQAVIAMENARLLGELRERTRDLQESLEYQTATSDVLKVISQSTFDLEPVLQTVLDTAMRLCGNSQGEIFRLEDGVYRMAVGYGMEPEYRDIEAKLAITPGPDTLVGRTALAGRPVQIVDALADPDYQPKDEAQIGKLRSMLGVPLLREGVPIGVICTARTVVEPFTEKQIALVSTFADQAVIAIENARLFNELRARTDELGRSVEELKMLSEVGRAVSSTLDLRTVLSTVLNASLGVTWANAGAIFRYSRAERAFRLVEAVGWDDALAHSVRELRVAETESAMGEAVTRRMPIQLADLAQRASYPLRDVTLAAGFHSALIVPLVGAERTFGAIILMRQEAGEFPPETVRLMQTLASQSVLAIQNARLFREIAGKSEQLALASQHKSQFLANMSHELRTPLNAILGYAELLVDGIYGVLPDRPKGVLERIQNNGKHLLALINDVLDLAKIEAGQLTLTLEDYSLPEVVQSVVTATEPLATSKGLKFTAVLQDDLPMAHGDARRVAQVLLNLVGNAIKFTDEGEVEIRAMLDKGQFVMTVRDTGPGIADADQERIFGEFQQIDNTNTRKKGGTGLGLAISKRMVEIQGGTISVDSAWGKGSTFRVVLPVHVDEMLEAAE